jgi:hypothetical protein
MTPIFGYEKKEFKTFVQRMHIIHFNCVCANFIFTKWQQFLKWKQNKNDLQEYTLWYCLLNHNGNLILTNIFF